MRTARLSGLAGGAGGEAEIPVREIEDLAIGGAMDLLEAGIGFGVVDGGLITGSRDWGGVERGLVRRAEAGERMLEGGFMEAAPSPARGIIAEQLSQARDCRAQRARQ